MPITTSSFDPASVFLNTFQKPVKPQVSASFQSPRGSVVQAKTRGVSGGFCSVPSLSMSLRRTLGYSDGELMRSDSKPCSRLMRQTAAVFAVGGAFGFWVLCRLHYGARITVPRSLRWATTGALTVSLSTATMVGLFSPECEPQNIAAYDTDK